MIKQAEQHYIHRTRLARERITHSAQHHPRVSLYMDLTDSTHRDKYLGHGITDAILSRISRKVPRGPSHQDTYPPDTTRRLPL